ncbi:hypothetical protein [Sphingomonas montana]|uniref:hypothetical protein n=1 Tax=Sphingomonas montana TaxID=1843236 RepID=UPI00096E57DC|nr:hypothetical protein [Sphingomonas montana]
MSAALVAAAAPAASQVQQAPDPVAAASSGFADLADLAVRAPIVAGVEIRRAVRLKPAEAIGVAAGETRFFVEADLVTLLRGKGGLPARVSYLVDQAPDARGRPPRLKGMRVLLLATPVAGRPGELQLVGRDAQIDWTPVNEQRLRMLATALVAPDAPPTITGVSGAFHVPGSLPGESETQIFLTTASARPVSLSILRRPGQEPRWAVSLSDIVDETAATPVRDTLLWYRLACGLPATLPEAATAALSPEENAAARADYAVVQAGLGRCR